MSWYMTLVVSPSDLKPLPDSWTALWGGHPNAWGVMTGSQSPIFEIAANLYFGGNEVLMHKEGIDAVIGKIAELKANVKLWWQDEGTMQTALTNEDVVGGTYMHDTAMVMARSSTLEARHDRTRQEICIVLTPQITQAVEPLIFWHLPRRAQPGSFQNPQRSQYFRSNMIIFDYRVTAGVVMAP